MELGLPLLRGVFTPDMTEPPHSRGLDVSREEEIETSLTLEASQMAQNPAFLRGAGRWGQGDPFAGCMGCNFVVNLTKSCIGHRDNQAFIL